MSAAANLRAACNGHPHAKIPWPHRVLHDGADTIDDLVAAAQAAKAFLINDLEEPGRTVFWKLTDAIRKAEA